MATRLKPTRINVDNTPRVGDGAAYQNDNDFHWSEGGGDMSYEDFEWVTLTGNSLVIEKISNNVTPTGNFTVTAGTLRPGIEYVLRVNTGNTPYTMTLGTGVTNPNGYSTDLTPNKVNQFKFIATSDSQLELEGIDTSDFVTLGTQQTITAKKTFNVEPELGTAKTTDATNNGTKFATEAQVFKKADDNKVVHITGTESITGDKTFQISPTVPSKSTDAGNNPTTIATEAQVAKKIDKVQSPTADHLASLTSGGEVADSGIAKSTVELNTNKETGDAPTDTTSKYPSSHTVKKYVDDQVAAATAGAVSNDAYDPTTWDGVTGIAPSKNAVRDKIVTMDSAISGNTSNISTINGKIPSEASTSNQLADKAYVGDSINSVTAFYITKNAAGDQFATYAELAAATTFYSGGQVRVPTRNDYTIVLDDENHDHATTRYIYNSVWEYQYTVNETPLTQAQLNALNSGITAGKVSTYDAYATNKQDTLVSGTNIKTINNTSILGSGNINTNQVSDTAYGSSWDGVTGTAPSKNAVYDKINAMDTTISNKADASKTIKVFEISGSSDTTNAQAAVDWFKNGGVPVILYGQNYHYLANNIPLEDQSNPTLQFISTDTDYATMNTIEIWATNYTVRSINIRANNFVKSVGGSSGAVSLKTVNNNALVGSGNIQIDAVIKSATAPASATQGDLWYDTTNNVLKVYNGSAWKTMQELLVSGTNIKTVNSTSLLGSGNIAVQPTLVSGTNIKTINGNSILGSGNITVSSSTTITVTLTSAGWSSNSQTVSATGVTASNTVIVSPAPSDIADYADCGVYCSAQGSGTLTFGCDTAPSGDIVVNVLIMS